MVTVHREGGMRFVIYLDDHDPAHVHLYGDGEARIDIVTLRILSIRGMNRRDAARPLAITTEHRDLFLQRWTEIHG